MAQFTSKDRQRIIDDYLNATGLNQFVPAEFVDWLARQKGHEAYEWFFGKSDAEAAREYRIGLARQMASGLRISAAISGTPESSTVSVRVREFPAMVSPVSGRKDGGGYQPFHPDDPAMVDELCAQSAQSLSAWLGRYRGVAEMRGIDLGAIEEIVVALGGHVDLAA